MPMRKIFLIIFLAAIYALIFTAPNLIVKNYSPTSSASAFDYKVIDDLLYGAYYKDLQEGNFGLTDPANYEHKDDALPWASMQFLIIGGLAYLTGSIDTSLLIVIAVFSFLNFLIQYLFLKNLTKNSFISVLGVFLIPLTHVFMTSPSKILYFLFNYPLSDRFLWASIPRRQVEMFFLFAPLLVFYLAYINKNKILAILSGLFVGLASETYVYYFTFEIAGIFLLFLFARYKKDMEEIKLIGTALISSLLFSLPYMLKTQFFNHDFPHSLEFLSRLGLSPYRSLTTIYISLFFVLFLIIFFVYFKLTRKTDKTFYFLNAFFIGNLLLYNQHIITGMQLQSWHWLTVTGRPWLLIMTLYLFSSANDKSTKKQLTNMTVCMLILFVVGWSLWANIGVAKNLANYYQIDQEYYKAFDWLNKNTPKGSVVLSPSFIISANIPLRTHNNVYLVNGFHSAAPDYELICRGLFSMKIFNISSEKIFNPDSKQLMSAENLLTYLFHMRYYPEPPKQLKQKFINIYKLSEVGLEDFLNYKLDYILLGKKEKEMGLGITKVPSQKVYSDDGLEIYKVNASNSTVAPEFIRQVCHESRFRDGTY